MADFMRRKSANRKIYLFSNGEINSAIVGDFTKTNATIDNVITIRPQGSGTFAQIVSTQDIYYWIWNAKKLCIDVLSQDGQYTTVNYGYHQNVQKKLNITNVGITKIDVSIFTSSDEWPGNFKLTIRKENSGSIRIKSIWLE